MRRLGFLFLELSGACWLAEAKELTGGEEAHVFLLEAGGCGVDGCVGVG